MRVGDEDLLDELYLFVKARAEERIRKAHGQDMWALQSARSHLRWLQSSYASAKRMWHGVTPTIDYFREVAMRHRDHPDYRPEWTIEK